MDFHGQKLAEDILKISLVVVFFLGWVYGFITESLTNAFLVVAGGSCVTALIVLPPWPFYSLHPVYWLPPPKKNHE